MDHANPLPSILATESIQKPKNSPLGGYVLALVVPFIITVGLLYAYSRYSNNIDQRLSFALAKKIIRVDDGTFGLSPIGSVEEYKEVLGHLTPTPRIVADTLASSEADLRAPTARDPFAPAIIDLQKPLNPTPAKLLANGSTLYASQNGKTYVFSTTSGRDPKQTSIIPEGGTLLSRPDGLFILSAEAPGSSRLSAYQTKDPTKPTKLWTLTTSQTSHIAFSTLYKDELVLGISSSLAPDLPCAMTVATIDDKPVDINCATILYPTTPFVPDSILTILKMPPVTAEVISSFSSFVRKETSDSHYLGSDSIYLPYPLAQRTGIVQISLSDLNVAHNLQIKGHLVSPGGLHELSDSKLVAVTDSSRSNEWNLTISYPGSSPVPPPEVFQKAVGQASMYLAQNHLYLPPTTTGEPYQIIDFATNAKSSSASGLKMIEKHTRLYGLDEGLVLLAEMFVDKSNLSLANISDPTSSIRLKTNSLGTVLLRSGYVPYGMVVNPSRQQFFLKGRDAGYFFSYTSSGSVRLEKTLTNLAFEQVISGGNKMYFHSNTSIDSINLDTFKMSRLHAF